MMNRKIGWFLFVFGLVLILCAGGVLIYLEMGIPPGYTVKILERGGDQLAGTYYPGDIDQGVILAEGFGSDQAALRSLVDAFAGEGYHILTFDFSGHGRSPGGLGFDNAETDRLALQILDAKEIFKQRSGLGDGQILIAGHSLGARAALQSAVLDDNPPVGLILIGTQVNLVTNVQAEVFTGVSDNELAWVQSLSLMNPETNILMISGDLDDIITVESAGLLIEKLSGENIEGKALGLVEENNWRRWELIPGVLHNYEIYSRKVIEQAIIGANTMTGQQGIPRFDPDRSTFRYSAWLIAIAGTFLGVLGSSQLLPGQVMDEDQEEILLLKPGRYFLGKIALWFPALIPGGILGGLIFLLPLGNPAFNLIYISFLGGYGILNYFIYRKGWMPGVEGSWKPRIQNLSRKNTLFSLSAFILILLLTSLFARSGWFFVLPANHRLIWAVIFTPITALGFWIGWQENHMILNSSDQPVGRLIGNTLIGLLPFFLYAGFLAFIGSLSGVIGAVQGLLILFLAISSGILFQKLGKNTLLTSLLQSFLIYWLILAQGVLFS